MATLRPRFQLEQVDQTRFNRVQAGSELELRLSSVDDARATSLTKEHYDVIVKGLINSPFVIQEGITKERYTNNTYSINTGSTSIREKVSENGHPPSYMIKTKIANTAFSFHGFTVKLGEAVENNIGRDQFASTSAVLQNQRQIDRITIPVYRDGLRFRYECSVVTAFEKDGRQRVTHEIELELPLDAGEISLYEYGRLGMSYLIELMYEPNHLPPSFFVKEETLLKKDIELVREMTRSSTKALPKDETSLNIRNDPINLKTKDIPDLDNYALTNKLDGERRLVIGLGKPELLILNPSGFNKSKVYSAYYLPMSNPMPFMVLDTEFYENGFYVFDVIQPPSAEKISSQIDASSSHPRRMSVLTPELIDFLNKDVKVRPKQFYYGKLSENLTAFLTSTPHDNPFSFFSHNDGLIFTQKNAGYLKAQHLKFKFGSKMSIDFQLMNGKQLPNTNQFTYQLYAQRYDKSTESVQLIPFTETVRGTPQPVTLTTFTFYPPEVITIVECVYNKTYRSWKVLRERTDKTYPNSIKVAIDVMQDIRQPITLQDFGVPIDNFYLAQIDYLEKTFAIEESKKKGIAITEYFDLDFTGLLYLCAEFFNIYNKGKPDDGYLNAVYHAMDAMRRSGQADPEVLRKLSDITGHQFSYYNEKDGQLLEPILHELVKKTPQQTTVLDARSWSILPYDQLKHMPTERGRNASVVTQLEVNPAIKKGRFPTFVIDMDSQYARYTTVEDHSNPKSIKFISQYSSLMPWHTAQVTSIMKAWFPVLNITADLTANVGVDTIHLAQLYPTARIEAFEIEPTFCSALQDNVREFGLQDRVVVWNKNSNEIIRYWIRGQFDMVYIDAPWGGRVEKGKSPDTDLYLQAESDPVKERRFNIKSVAQYLLNKEITSSVVIKVPSYYNQSDLRTLFTVEEAVVNNPRDGKVSYLLFKLTPLQNAQPIDSSCTVGLWSMPIIDQYDRLFRLTNKQSHAVVRVPVDMDYENIQGMLCNYHYPPLRNAQLIDRARLIESATRLGYQLYKTIDVFHPTRPSHIIHQYHHFTLASLAVAQPVQRLVQPSRGVPQQQVQQPQQLQPYQRVATKANPSFPQTAYQKNALTVNPPPPPMPLPANCAEPKEKSYEDLSSSDHMRKYHNNEKKNIVNMFCKNRSVLDIGAGYGGDLHKYNNANVTRLVLVEPDAEHIHSDQGLLCRIDKSPLKDKITVIQAGGEDTQQIVDTNIIPYGRVQVVASFMSMTFLFQSREILRNFLNTVNSSLVEGGYFIGTMMDGEKTFQKMLGRKELVLGKGKLIKHYSDTDKKDTGMKLWINIDDTIVENQNEYLAIFSILQEEMAHIGFELKVYYDFDPTRYNSSSMIDAGDRQFSQLFVGFAFRKMPKSIPGQIHLLKIDATHEFFNLYGEMSKMIRTGVNADGSCFYHAFLYQMSQAYRNDQSVRMPMMMELRKNFSAWITRNQYMAILPYHFHQWVNDHADTLFTVEENTIYYKQISLAYDKTFSTLLVKLPEPILRKLTQAMDDIVESLKKEVANKDTWANEIHISLFMHFQQTNIYFIDSVTRTPILLLLHQYKTSYKRSVVLFAINLYHFEPLAFIKNEMAERVLTPFNPHAIYLHHTLLKKNLQNNVIPPIAQAPQDDRKESIVKMVQDKLKKVAIHEQEKKDRVEEEKKDKEARDSMLMAQLFNYQPIQYPNYMIQQVKNTREFRELFQKFMPTANFVRYQNPNNSKREFDQYKTVFSPILSKLTRPAKELQQLFDSGSDDRTIIEYTKANLTKEKRDDYISGSQASTEEIIARGKAKKATQIATYIQSYVSKVTDYLDVGCSDGTTTIAIGSQLGLDKNHIYGVDVEEFASEPIKPKEGFKFHKYTVDDLKLPYADKSFDVVTVLVTLHHVKNPIAMLYEIHRVLRPQGIVLFREHDRANTTVDQLARLEHLFYSQLVHHTDYDVYMNTKSEQYFSKKALEEVASQVGLTKLVDYENQGKKPNPTAIYHILFLKK